MLGFLTTLSINTRERQRTGLEDRWLRNHFPNLPNFSNQLVNFMGT